MSMMVFTLDDFYECDDCGGSGKSKKKRTKECPKCLGSKIGRICRRCDKRFVDSQLYDDKFCRCFDIPPDAI